jgi:site-specific recombinase XerD
MNALRVIEPTEHWVSLWLAEFQSVNTRDAYGRDVRRFFEFCPRALPNVTRQHLVDFRCALEAAGLVAKSRNRIMAAIGSLIGFVHRCEPDYLPRNVSASLKAERTERVRKTVPDEHALGDLLESAQNIQEQLALKMLYFTGCRAHELATIHWGDMQPGPVACAS